MSEVEGIELEPTLSVTDVRPELAAFVVSIEGTLRQITADGGDAHARFDEMVDAWCRALPDSRARVTTAEAVTLDVRPCIARLVLQMEVRLREFEFIGGWAENSSGYLLSCLQLRVDDLVRACREDDNWTTVLVKSADVANYAMMIHDLASRAKSAINLRAYDVDHLAAENGASL